RAMCDIYYLIHLGSPKTGLMGRPPCKAAFIRKGEAGFLGRCFAFFVFGRRQAGEYKLPNHLRAIPDSSRKAPIINSIQLIVREGRGYSPTFLF
ncbi:hypothetical protein, partial [Sinorhizobium meliloti]|uniref:hypothetical protein n=1 Tax=Rhizobium meliloti TaxID=382 RepID=UPI001AECE7C6